MVRTAAIDPVNMLSVRELPSPTDQPAAASRLGVSVRLGGTGLFVGHLHAQPGTEVGQ